MASVFPKSGLKEGEKVLWYAKPKVSSILGRIILSMILMAIGIIFPILSLIVFLILVLSIIRFRARTYWITSMRAIEEYSFIGKSMKETSLDHITDVVFNQGLFGRLFNFGNIHIHTAGTGFLGLDFKGIGDPVTVRGTLINAKDTYKSVTPQPSITVSQVVTSETMKCSKCGAIIPSHAKFCPNCGASI